MLQSILRLICIASFPVLATLAAAAPPSPIRLVSAPTPNVFPLLLAMARHPGLPVQLVPVQSTGQEMNDEFEMGEADGMLGMTYAIAQKAAAGKPSDLRLRGVYFWRGSFAALPKASSVSSLAGLATKGIIVSGPLTGGRGGAPDLLFHAAVERSDHTASDYFVCYVSALEGIALIAAQAPMNSNSACDKSQGFPAASIFLVEPAVTGLVMKTNMIFTKDEPMKKGISIENLFTGYTAWPLGQLPHGGWAVRASVLQDPTRSAQLEGVEKALKEASQELADVSAKGLISRLQVALIISNGMKESYGKLGVDLPTLVLAQALGDGDLVYRADLTIDRIKPDLLKFLIEILKAPVQQQLLY